MLGRLRRVTLPRSSPTGRGTRMFGVSGMGLDSCCKPKTTLTRTVSRCWMSSRTRFQLPSRMASTAVSKLFLLANCRRIPPRTDPMSEMAISQQLRAPTSYADWEAKRGTPRACLSCGESDSVGLCWPSASFLLCREEVAKLGFVLPHAPFRALDQRRQLGLKRFKFGSTHRLLHANRSIQFPPAV
jgi:hypothetical protein